MLTASASPIGFAAGTAALSAIAAFLPSLLKAIVLLAVCLILMKVLLAASGKVLNKSKLDKSLHAIILSTLKVLLIFLTIMIVAPSLGIETSSLLAVLSIAGVAVSLSIQGILGNFFSGITLLISKPFKIGDFVPIGGQTGVIVETGITHTKLHTVDNQVILVPNSSVTSNVITNVSTEDKRRLDFVFSASYNAPTEAVKEALAEAVDIPQVLKDEPVFIALSKYGDYAIEYTVRVWVKNADYWDANFQILERVRTCFQAQNVEMTYPHINVHTV